MPSSPALPPVDPPPARTRFAGCSRREAVAVLGLLVASTVWFLAVALTQETIPGRSAGAAAGSAHQAPGDAEFFATVVRRVQAGANYYDVVGEELPRRGYTPHSVLNWRTPPLHAWLCGSLVGPVGGQVLLILGVLATALLAHRAVRQAGGTARAGGALLLLLGPFAWCAVPDICLFTELWAGMLIALSVCAGSAGRWRLAVLAGLAALFFRELALPYCLIALALAGRGRRWTEAFSWLAGLAGYCVFFTFHALAAARRLPGGGAVHASSWLQHGGTAFVLLTTQINYFLLVLLPAWVAAFYLPLGLLGLAAWRGPAGTRAFWTVLAYVAAFTLIGFKPHNAYWGLLYAPLLALGVAWSPAALRDLIAALRQAACRERHRSGHGYPVAVASDCGASGRLVRS
jgi:hypothetical protein